MAFAVLFGGMRGPRIEYLGAKAQKAVKEQIPDQIHIITNIQFGPCVKKHTKKEKNYTICPVEKRKLLW